MLRKKPQTFKYNPLMLGTQSFGSERRTSRHHAAKLLKSERWHLKNDTHHTKYAKVGIKAIRSGLARAKKFSKRVSV